MEKLILAAIAMLSMNLVHAIEVAGVRFDDKVTLASSDLVANGAGLRQKAFFKIYAMALYLPEKQHEADVVLGARGPKRISISLLRDVSAQQFIDALIEGVEENHTEVEKAALKDRVRQFSDAMLGIGEARTGTIVNIDWIPESGTRLVVNGQARGKDIVGEEFFNALLKIWLGNRPVNAGLKQALLGKAGA